MGKHGGLPGWPARLLVSALVAGVAVAAQFHGAQAEAPKGGKTDKTEKIDKKEEARTPSVATVGHSGKIERSGGKPDDKAAGKTEVKTEAKTEAKTEVKTDAKTEAKTEAKIDAKTEGKAEAKTDAKDAKIEGKAEAKIDGKGEARSEGKTEAKAEVKKPEKAAAAKAAKGAAADEPAPPLTPPIKMSALREEMSRPVHKEERAGGMRSERERLEQLAAEINKAREGLRQDTVRLEALLAARDSAAQAASSTTSPAGAGDGGDPPTKKIPTTLDSLAKAIRGMKPEQAAPIMSRVDRKLAADVLLRMPGADAGKVMGLCKPEVAAELAAEIASRTPRAELRR
ncbi:MAG TPA: hypothetical protein VFH68_15995 [Polyangia bacterium]|nr:hypothetical protein [Polyangia bacterium]